MLGVLPPPPESGFEKWKFPSRAYMDLNSKNYTPLNVSTTYWFRPMPLLASISAFTFQRTTEIWWSSLSCSSISHIKSLQTGSQNWRRYTKVRNLINFLDTKEKGKPGRLYLMPMRSSKTCLNIFQTTIRIRLTILVTMIWSSHKNSRRMITQMIRSTNFSSRSMDRGAFLGTLACLTDGLMKKISIPSRLRSSFWKMANTSEMKNLKWTKDITTLSLVS